MRLRQKQSLLVSCLEKLFAYARAEGWEFTLGEGSIKTPRKTRRWDGEKNKRTVTDGEHMVGSLHYQRLAIDLNLFVGGRYIRSGSHPAYVKLGTYWESLHELCRWGGRFRDANHFSIGHAGKA